MRRLDRLLWPMGLALGLTAESVGSTEVTLENGESGETVTFTVDVVPSSEY